MSMSQEIAKGDNLYIQIWRNPIFYRLLLATISAEQWQTLTALAVFMNNKGECNPSLSKLSQILGLNSVASVSRRIKSLESARFEGKTLIEVGRGKKKQVKGRWIFTKNTYLLNQEIVTIFAPHETTSAYRRLQTEKLQEDKAKFLKSHDVNEKRSDDNITRRSF